jgi:drug/metabolite transporter (DMT)-like permease
MTQDKVFFGIAIMIASMALFATKDGFAKVIVENVNPAQLIWVQFVFAFAVLAAATAPQNGLRAFFPKPLGLQVLRGLASVGGIGTFYWSLSYIPLADATAMVLVAPLVTTALSPFLLAEKIGIRRIAAVLFGFAGVLVILRPGFGGQGVGYLIGLMAGVLYGLNYIGNRHLGALSPPLVNVAHNVLPGVVVLAPVMPFVWSDPFAAGAFPLTAFLVIALLGHSLMVSAFIFAPAFVIAPYQYTVIVFASLIGMFAFKTFPDAVTWTGIVMIVGAGLFIALREKQLAGQE